MVTLRPHQIAAVDAVEQAFRDGITRPLIDCCVGSGKSLIFAELARREIERGGRVIIGAHTRELVEQNAAACRELGLCCGINAAALGERTWRAPVISAAIQSIYKSAHQLGKITLICGDEAHLWPHSESGMYRELHRGLDYPNLVGGSGTVFRLQGGSLVEGDEAPFQKVVYQYSILDGIRDGYLCSAFSIGADDKIDTSQLRTRQGEFTGDSSDKQMLGLIDNHIMQMLHHGEDRRAWLVFEASVKSAQAMASRMRDWNIATGLVLGETPAAERAHLIEQFRRGRLRALVNVAALTTGFDVPHVDLLVMRRPTQSLGLYIQMCGRALRCVGGNINASMHAGKADCAVLDFAANIDRHGPLDFITQKQSKPRLVSCESCGKRNPAAAAKCWNCSAEMFKLCPACLKEIAKHHLDCPHCAFDMRTPRREDSEPDLRTTPSGAVLISGMRRVGHELVGGWQPVPKDWVLRETFPEARWARYQEDRQTLDAVLIPNGHSRSSARLLTMDGSEMIIPLPVALPAA